MQKRKLLLLFLFLMPVIIKAQDYPKKSIGIGFNHSFSFLGWNSGNNRAKIPNEGATTPFLLFSIRRHEIAGGIDAYWVHSAYTAILYYKMWGYQLGYKYYLYKRNKYVNLFAVCNFRYVQYGAGSFAPVAYNYYATDDYNNQANLIRYKSFINTFGIGFRSTFLKIVGFQFAISGGYNYYQCKFSPSNSTQQIYFADRVGNYINPLVFMEFGLSLKLWKTKN